MAKTADNLTLDACAARAAGMSYGKYMAAKCAGTLPSVPEVKDSNPPEYVG